MLLFTSPPSNPLRQHGWELSPRVLAAEEAAAVQPLKNLA